MRTIHARARRALGLLAVAGLLAACSGAAATPNPAATSGTAASAGPQASRSTGSATNGGPGTGMSFDACALLTEADIKEITGFAVAKVIPDPADSIFPAGCQWMVVDAAWQVFLGVSSPGGQAMWDRLVPYTQGDAVSGIGDEAFLSEMGGDLMVRLGDVFIDVQYVAVGEPEGTQDRLAKRVLERLP
jgi:hypothetical protein